jgi:hypothetical protein
MLVHHSLGVGTLVALMEAHHPATLRPVTSRRVPDAEEAARIDAWLQSDMLPTDTEAGPVLCSAPGRST